MTLPCIVCKTSLRPVFDGVAGMVGDTNQPSDGLAFSTPGAYGSTVFDPMNGEYIEINVCDECLKAAAAEEAVLWNVRSVPIVAGKTTVGRRWVHRPQVPWKPGLGREEDVISIEVEEIGNMPDYPSIEWIDSWEEIKDYLLTKQAEADAAWEKEHGE